MTYDDRPDPTTKAAAASALAPGWLAAVALVWLAVMLRSVQETLVSNGDAALGITEAAFGLPALVSAALVGGAATGLAVRRLAIRLRRSDVLATRLAAAVASGLVVGAAAAGYVVLTYPQGSVRPAIAGTVAAGAVLGGLVAGVRVGALAGAGATASLVVLLLTVVRELFKAELLDLFGAGDTPVSVVGAQRWVANLTSVVAGLAAGLVAFYYLRRAARRSGTVDGAAALRWPAYLTAGGSVGAMMLATEAITRIGGGRVLELAGSVSESDRVFQNLANTSRINSALIVFFVGALTAIIALGRTLKPAPEPESAPEPEPESTASPTPPVSR
jgi:hypothetical protein